ncbi:tetrathionate reductase family octaheme c-type cytochrome [Dethiosulfatarculus sandiegensis]|uniref:Cytochrome C n=1 Tax=Dethiosulfatarculus sandiegensis TaxID=1429043 RepID=A0A0D2G7A7_9BACT|nr:tetrathionate reductase family octaheme c-type cytochrome [Dethiosulfatarculus sandiegensis]KIX10857.1 cytochrome C [Dethiosulfatarculus sandiegensis]
MIRRKKAFQAAVICWTALLLAFPALIGAAEEKSHPLPGQRWDTADHSRFEVLQQPFENGPQVTKACLSCHNEAATQVMQTIHWTWMCPKAPAEAKLGKGGWVVNNFCIAMPSNEPRCTSCHAGYGWKNKSFDFTDQTKVDCLVCHEQTGTYKKFPAGAGNPVSEPKVFPGNKKKYFPPDWNKVAQSVDKPTRKNCGVCHFFGGGGDGVKHGDLDSSMLKPDKNLDVHMAVEGKNFTCARCHTTVVHKISGRCYKTPAAKKRVTLIQDDQTTRITCVSCHTEKPHDAGVKANDHTDKVACQTCHIPAFARKLPTKMMWDWSTAGKMNKEGKPFAKKEKIGPVKRPVYATKKGNFIWKMNVTPDYKWFNGSVENVMLTTPVDPARPVDLTIIEGTPNHPDSRIYPFKTHKGKTPYDAGRKRMAVPHLFGKDKNAYWKSYDWKLALAAGQEYVGLPFSGEVGFIDTNYHFQITHQVAPKSKALACVDCHNPKKSRLAGVPGVYMPGRDRAPWLDYVGWGAVLAALLGVLLHGLGRAVLRRKNGR